MCDNRRKRGSDRNFGDYVVSGDCGQCEKLLENEW